MIFGAGMLLYDLFSYTGGRSPGVPHHRHLTKRQMLRAAPSLAPDAFVGGLAYYDAQVDDARYVANLARTASFYGAHVASRVRVEGFSNRDVGAIVLKGTTGKARLGNPPHRVAETRMKVKPAAISQWENEGGPEGPETEGMP